MTVVNLERIIEGVCPKCGDRLEPVADPLGDHGWCKPCDLGWSANSQDDRAPGAVVFDVYWYGSGDRVDDLETFAFGKPYDYIPHPSEAARERKSGDEI